MKLLRRIRYGLIQLSGPASCRLQREWAAVESPALPEWLRRGAPVERIGPRRLLTDSCVPVRR